MSEPLQIANKLFRTLEQQRVRHCHWKSNEHLGDALAGCTDVDLLAAKSQAMFCEEALTSLGYKRVISQPWARYPGIEDWIGFDKETGKLVHIHLHYQLLSGKQYVKEQHLPWENLILDTAVQDPRFNVFVTDPNLEIILVVIRVGLKTSFLDLFAALFGRQFLPKNMRNEFDYLVEQIDEKVVRKYAVDLLGCEYGQKISTIIFHKLLARPGAVLQVKSVVNQALGRYTRCNQLETTVLYLFHSLQFFFSKVQRGLGISSQLGKRLHTGGAIIAVIGSDGAGKSTVSKELQKWLSWKIDTRTIYLGSGDGSVGLMLRGLKYLASLLTRRKATEGTSRTARSDNIPQKSIYKELGAGLLAVSVADERYNKILKAKRVRLNGGISICDRYPQDQFMGIYDGPRLCRGENKSKMASFFAQQEARRYQYIAQMPPDVVIKLHIPDQVALDRKPDHSLENIRRKGEITHKLGFTGSKVMDIDASGPIEDVIKSVKTAVWESL